MGPVLPFHETDILLDMGNPIHFTPNAEEGLGGEAVDPLPEGIPAGDIEANGERA